jgi:hypothetical protein
MSNTMAIIDSWALIEIFFFLHGVLRVYFHVIMMCLMNIDHKM